MKPVDTRICPACGARNKAKWEFCARCGESLEGVTPGATAPAKGAENLADDDRGVPVGSILGGLLAVAAVWYVFANPPTIVKPDPASFTVPSMPVVPPATLKLPPVGSSGKLYAEAQRLLQSGDAAAAVRLLSQALEDEPNNPLLRNAYGLALLTTGAREEALEQFRQAAALAPGQASYRVDLARAYDAVGRTKESIVEFEAVLKEAPDNIDVLRGLAEIYNRSGTAEGSAKALPYLSHAAEVNPSDLVLRQQLGYAYDKTGDLTKAAQHYKQVLDAMPQAAVTRGLLGDLMFRQGKKDEAIALVQAGLDSDPKSPVLHRTLGSLLEGAGEIDKAIAQYREYARLAPNAEDAKKLSERAATLERQQQQQAS